MELYIDDEPETLITLEHVFKNNQHIINQGNNNLHTSSPTFLFDFHVVYNRIPDPNSDGDDDFNLNNWVVQEARKTHELDKNFLMGGNRAHIVDFVNQMLNVGEVPTYRDIVDILTEEILDLQKRVILRVSPEVERIKVGLKVIVRRLPGEPQVLDDHELAVAPASDEAVETHLESMVVENGEGYCVICMETIRTRSEAARMPCSHVFHRLCGETWLRSSATCPVCRATCFHLN